MIFDGVVKLGYIIICDGDSYSIGGNNYTLPGLYEDTLIAANGCDSMVNTNLTVLPNSTQKQKFRICDGESIVIGNNTYNTTCSYIPLRSALMLLR